MSLIIKKIIKWFFIILGLLLCLFMVLMILINSPKEKIKIPSIKDTKCEKVAEWYDDDKKCTMIKVQYTFDGLNGVGYYEQQKLKAEQLFKERDLLEKEAQAKNLQSYLNRRMIDINSVPNNPELDHLSQKIMKNHDELIKINQRLVLDRLQNQPEPSNLACYIKDCYPFDRWNNQGLDYTKTSINGFKFFRSDTRIDSYLDGYIKIEKQFYEDAYGNCLILKYNGPKYLIEEDKDYYLGSAQVSDSNFELTNFHLHFNPVRKTLSLYQEKHHNNKAKEVEYLSKTNNDW
ncbi:MAG: hypothetical protein Q8807_02735 ['Waltheria sp.' little leaf phytoplasma]|nr:hypothetical protein ['Waltheria sp.' little leaf phytoplasma]